MPYEVSSTKITIIECIYSIIARVHVKKARYEIETPYKSASFDHYTLWGLFDNISSFTHSDLLM